MNENAQDQGTTSDQDQAQQGGQALPETAPTMQALLEMMAGNPYCPQELRDVMPALVIEFEARQAERADVLARLARLETAVAAWGG